MKRTLTIVSTFAIVAALSVVAVFASVTFDPATGTGFVGKGDVQIAYGWTNAQLQSNAGSLTFNYDLTQHYDAVCEFTTGEGTRGQKTHDVTTHRVARVSNGITFDARTRKQITGFNLTGISDSSTTGDIPAVGDTCPGGSTLGTYISVTEGASEGGLFVNFGGQSNLLDIQ